MQEMVKNARENGCSDKIQNKNGGYMALGTGSKPDLKAKKTRLPLTKEKLEDEQNCKNSLDNA